MSKQPNRIRLGVLAAIILLAALSRLIGPVFFGGGSNFAPVGAIALFGGAYLGRTWLALVIPLAALFLSDLLLAWHGQYYMFYQGFYWQYMAFGMVVLIGMLVLKKIQIPRLVGASLLASVSFFLISNFGVWASGQMYPMTFSGLWQCYVMGIPFFRGTLLGDLFYTMVLFGAFEMAKMRFSVLASYTDLFGARARFFNIRPV